MTVSVDRIIAYESGELNTIEVVELFADLVKSGMAWTLQGSYGRSAQSLINSGFITAEGEVDRNMVEAYLEN